MDLKNTLLAHGADIWEGRIRPSIFWLDSLLPESARDKERRPGVQVIRSKGQPGEQRDNSVFGLKGGIDAVLATVERQTGEKLTINGLATRLTKMSGPNVTLASINKTLHLLNDGRVISWERAEGVARLIGIDTDELVGTFPNAKGSEVHEVRRQREIQRLAEFQIQMRQVTGSVEDINWLEESLRGARRLDLAEDFFLAAGQPNFEKANRAFDLVRTALKAWKETGATGSVERGRLSKALAELAEAGMHLHCGRVARLIHWGDPEDCDAYAVKVLVGRFAPVPEMGMMNYPRVEEYGLSIDDEDEREAAREALAWAGQKDF